jgi:hypothetical protein
LFLVFKFNDVRLKKGVGIWLVSLRINEIFTAKNRNLDPYYVALTMFTCNFIGIICARSLHY